MRLATAGTSVACAARDRERLWTGQWNGFRYNALKPSNPKDITGSDNLPLHLWPETATALGCLGLLDGALKCACSNFRTIGVRASIYYDACRRHLNRWFEGEDLDPDSGPPHLAHALASEAVPERGEGEP